MTEMDGGVSSVPIGNVTVKINGDYREPHLLAHQHTATTLDCRATAAGGGHQKNQCVSGH